MISLIVQSALILRCFLSRESGMLITWNSLSAPMSDLLSNTLPRSFWPPRTQKDTDLVLENAQRRFNKSISKLHYLPHTARLSSLNIPTLACRRTHIDPCTVFRILHHFTNLNPTMHFTFRRSSRGQPFTLCKPPTRLDCCKFSFFSRVIDLWNSLPIVAGEAGSVSVFKARLSRVSF